MSSQAAVVATPDLLGRLQALCAHRELGDLEARLADVAALVSADMVRFEMAAPRVEQISGSAVERGAFHLLGQGGKRLRPICVALASRLGSGFDARACELAIAVELVHAATLLHDDVVDVGDTRRGAPAARTVFGNAVSIFAGDWLLIDALRRVRGAEVEGVLERLLDVIEEMILAESLQLELRGQLDTTLEQWFTIADGKTAALFRWAMYAGARAGGLGEPICASLSTYGRHLGVAFQAIDDVLDLTGDPKRTGKALFADLREGKLTYPIVLAVERDPDLRPLLEAVIAEPSEALTEQARRRVLATSAVEDCRALALEHAALAERCLDRLPKSRARDALATVARTTVTRSH